MNLNIINMLSDMQSNHYCGYNNYLSVNDINEISRWYKDYSMSDELDFDGIVTLLYDLYFLTDIDFRPNTEYNRIVTELSKKYKFNKESFLKMYNNFSKMLWR